MDKKILFGKLTLIYGMAGALTGYLILHPASMFIHQYYRTQNRDLTFLVMAFSRAHLPMALYFVVLGSLIGILFGIYPQIIASLMGRIQVLSVTDYLTGIYNRRYLFEKLAEELSRSSRYQRKLALLMLDIDHFKNYNDNHGHQLGDYPLKELAQLLTRSIRQQDFAARYGGEEFVVVAPETDKEQGVKLAEKIKTAIEEYPFKMKESQPNGRITVSIGVAEFPEGGSDADELVGKADVALYLAKDMGRNKVVAG
ncbi:GGDEF domain-containing protein [candidate division TA06 bacterium]|nr:GGDEF domain-containing protein [candidate division TA06 bacterium]